MRLDQNSYMEDNRGERFSSWSTYSDMFCSLLMIFILLFIFVMLQYVSAKANDEAQNLMIVQQLQDSLAAAEQEVALRDSAIAQVDELEARLLEAQGQISNMESRSSDHDLMIATYGGQIDRLTEDLQNAQIQLGMRNDEYAALQSQYGQLETDLEDSRAVLAETEAALADQQVVLAETEAALADQQAVLAETEAALADAQSTLQQRDYELGRVQDSLDDANADLEAAQLLIEEQQAEVNSVRALYNAQAAALAAASAQTGTAQNDNAIAEMQGRIDDLQLQLDQQAQALEQVAGIRLEIIGEIRNALNSEGIEARVDAETGAIVMSSELLFDVNESTLKPAGRSFLDNFFPVYFRALTQSTAADSIAQIVVEGHTDTTGGYMDNLELSLMRAQSVVEYCVGLLDGAEQQQLTGMISASGCSYSNPVYAADGSVDMDRSRRVEVKFTLTDQYMVEEIAKIIEN